MKLDSRQRLYKESIDFFKRRIDSLSWFVKYPDYKESAIDEIIYYKLAIESLEKELYSEIGISEN